VKLLIEFDKPLDYFLTKPENGRQFEHTLNRKASVKDVIESFGIPHTEVGHIFFNDTEIDFSFIPSSSGLLNVQSIKAPFNVMSPTFLRPFPLEQIKFLADVNVIKLGRLLIIMGFDVSYSPLLSDHEIANIAEKEARIILTRDTQLLKRKKVIFAKRIKSDYPYEQLIETIRFFGLEKQICFFSRCTKCNLKLVSVSKEKVVNLLEPKTKKFFDIFLQCPQCNNVFWKGSHFENIKKKISSIELPDSQFPCKSGKNRLFLL